MIKATHSKRSPHMTKICYFCFEPKQLNLSTLFANKKTQQTNSLKVREVDKDWGRDLANQDLSLCKKMQGCVLSVSVITD